MMIFLWPKLLFLLLAAPAAMAAYFQFLRRRKKLAAGYAHLAFLGKAAGPGPEIRRHVPPLLFLLALILLLLAVARPSVEMNVPSKNRTIILAIDTSISMSLDDVPPSRIAAAQAAAYSFVAEQPGHTRVGVVSFAATASVAQPPTVQRADIIGAIHQLQLQNGTAVGSAILVSLKLIFPDLEFDLNVAPGVNPALGSSVDQQGLKPQAPGSYTNAAIILLTDGRSMVGPDPVEAAEMAAERGVRVFTVGIGMPATKAWSTESLVAAASFDEESLMEIANVTKAKYFHAGNVEDLTEIYRMLNSHLVFEKEQIEVTALFAMAAAALVAVSGLISVMGFGRVV